MINDIETMRIRPYDIHDNQMIGLIRINTRQIEYSFGEQRFKNQNFQEKLNTSEKSNRIYLQLAVVVFLLENNDLGEVPL